MGEVLEWIEARSIENMRRDDEGNVTGEQGIAVRRGARHFGRRQGSAATGPVFDDHRLAQFLAEGGGKQAENEVRGAARCERDEDLDVVCGKQSLNVLRLDRS